MKIALLCPTRARPEQCKRMIESVDRTKSGRVDIFVAMSDVDASSPAYKPVIESNRAGSDIYMYPDGCPTVFKWNTLAEKAMGEGMPDNRPHKLFMLASDDIVFSTPLWDKALLDHYNSLENKIHVYHLRDSRSEDGTPHPIVTREWIEAIGYFLPPLFMHWFVDTWTVEIAMHCGAFTHMKDYLLIHDKPSDSGNADETHSRIRQQGWHDRDAWVNERCQHFLQFEKERMYKHFSQSARIVA